MQQHFIEFKTNIKNGIEAYMVLYYLDTNNLHIFVERLSIKMRKRRRKYNIINNKIFYIPTIKWIVYIAHSHGEWAEYIYAYSNEDKKWMLIKINNIGSRQLQRLFSKVSKQINYYLFQKIAGALHLNGGKISYLEVSAIILNRDYNKGDSYVYPY